MRHRFAGFVVLFLCFSLPVMLHSQTVQEELRKMRSAETITIDGKDFYIHTVKRGQTLYMISKIYDVQVNDIIQENPEVKEGIKADQKIRVPLLTPKRASSTVTPSEDTGAEKQIAAQKTDGQRPADLKATDQKAAVQKTTGPKSTSQKSTGQKSSDQKMTSTKTAGQKTGDQKSAGQKSTDQREAGLKNEPVEAGPPPTPAIDSVALVVKELPCGVDSSTKKRVYNVALMLPLFLKEAQVLSTESPVRNVIEDSKSLQFVAFYEGFRMALDTLRKTGLKIRLYVYDVDKDTARTRQVLRNPEVKSMDLIIGLLYHANFKIVAEFAEKNKITIVNPISERSDLVTGNPYIFKAIPSKKTQFDQLAHLISSDYAKDQVLIIRNGQYGDKEAPDRLRKACLDHEVPAQIVDGQEGAIRKLSKEKGNFLVVFSDNPAYSLDLTRRFYELRNDYEITLAGLPDWGSMEGLETEYLIALKAHVVAKSFIDYANPHVKWFVNEYQQTYKTDPSLLAFQGYDLATWFLSALKLYGTNFRRCVGEFSTSSLQTQYEFKSSKGNGFENQHWMIYKFENYKLVPAN